MYATQSILNSPEAPFYSIVGLKESHNYLRIIITLSLGLMSV